MLIQIRERSFLDLLDLTVVVIRERPKPILLAALVGVLPFALLDAYLTTDPNFPFLIFMFLVALQAPWATAPLTVVLGMLMFGERVTPGKVLKSLLRGLPAMILYQLVIRSILLVIPILMLLVPVVFMFLNEVILLERGKFFSVTRRCSVLAKENSGDYFGQWLGQFFFGFLFIAAFWFGTETMISALATPEVTWETPELKDLGNPRFHFSLWVTIVFFSVTRFLSYIDRRIRLEGWAVKLRLQEVGKSMEREGRW